MPKDLTPAAHKALEDAEQHAMLAFRERLTTLAPQLPDGASVGLIPLAVVYNTATGGVRISIGSAVPLTVAAEALKMALAQIEGLTTASPN